MLHILLTILKIIGIILLAILGLLILLLCIVFFVPLRYVINAETKGDFASTNVKIQFYWFLHLVSGQVTYLEEEIDYKNGILFERDPNDVIKTICEIYFNEKIILDMKRNSLEYCHNAFGGYKIIYNNLKIDMAFYDDLYLSGHLSTDFLFYDVFRKQILPFGFKNTEELKVIFDYYDQGFFNTNRRIRKAKKSIAPFTCNNYKKKHYYCRICQFITTLYFKGIKIVKKNFRKLEARACFRKKTLKK